jgi:putative ABC transport system ATP-binding protein
MQIISMTNVRKDYPLGETTVSALKGVNFAVEAGDLLSVVGPSGSGKTTLLNIIGCIDRPTSGVVSIAGQDITTLSDDALTDLRLYTVGFIFQTFNLIPVLNVLENVEFPLLLMKDHRLSKAEIKERAEHLIEEVGLTAQLRQRPAELSGGQRQRVAIARALVTNPKIVLADEPTANLDSDTGHKILELMRRLNEQHKTTFVFSTHDPDVLQYARRVVKIRDGLIVDDATILPQAAADAPTHAALAGRRVKNRQPRRRESSGARQKAK